EVEDMEGKKINNKIGNDSSCVKSNSSVQESKDLKEITDLSNQVFRSKVTFLKVEPEVKVKEEFNFSTATIVEKEVIKSQDSNFFSSVTNAQVLKKTSTITWTATPINHLNNLNAGLITEALPSPSETISPKSGPNIPVDTPLLSKPLIPYANNNEKPTTLNYTSVPTFQIVAIVIAISLIVVTLCGFFLLKRRALAKVTSQRRRQTLGESLKPNLQREVLGYQVDDTTESSKIVSLGTVFAVEKFRFSSVGQKKLVLENNKSIELSTFVQSENSTKGQTTPTFSKNYEDNNEDIFSESFKDFNEISNIDSNSSNKKKEIEKIAEFKLSPPKEVLPRLETLSENFATKQYNNGNFSINNSNNEKHFSLDSNSTIFFNNNAQSDQTFGHLSRPQSFTSVNNFVEESNALNLKTLSAFYSKLNVVENSSSPS
ncbi:hypothetical protein HDU92_008332, partial [Lobulomyces angularis]